MKTSTRMGWIGATLLVLCLPSNVVAQKIITTPDWPDPFHAGELIVGFTEEAIEPIAAALEQGVEEGQLVAAPHPTGSISSYKFVLSDPDTHPLVTGIASIDSLHRTYGLKSITPVSYDDPYGRKDRAFLFVFPEDTDVLHLMDLYTKLKEVQYACPNGVLRAAVTTPNDSLFAEQWAHNVNHLQSEYGWDIETGDSTVVIAIHDSGVDWEHPDLKDNIWVNPGEDLDGDGVVGDTDDINGVDDDDNDYEDDIIGWDFWDGDWDPQHTAGADTCHGTKVAGIAAAVTNNDSGVAGVAWNCKIMPVRIMRALGEGQDSDIIKAASGIEYARKNGADVLNMSWGFYASYDPIKTQIDSAYSDGLVLVAAAGNDDTEITIYPAGYNNVIAVAAVDSNDVKRYNSNYGVWITVSAPGDECWTTKYVNGAANPHQYHLGGATSIATAHVSGLAALLLSYDPSLTNSEVRDIIEKSADDIDSKNPTYQGKLGSGRINVFKALFRAKGYGNITTDVTWYNDIPLTGDVTVNNGVTLTIQPGVTVEFDTTDVSSSGRDSTLCELIEQGKFIAQGTSADSITFRSSSNTLNPAEWYGIVFESTADPASQVSYSRIQNAAHGVHCDHADAHVEHNTIHHCTIGIKGVDMGLIGSIVYNRIKDCITGVSLYDSEVPVQYNNLSSNVRSAYFFNTTSRVRYDTLNANTNSGIALMSHSDATFGDDQVVGNGLWGLRLWYKSDPVLRLNGKHNHIQENGGSARAEIHCNEDCRPKLGTSSFYGYNDIVPETGGKAIYIADPDTAITVIDAIGNYWGTSQPDSTELFYPSWAVDFRPYLTESQFKPAFSSAQEVEQQVALGMDLEEQGAYGEAIAVYRGVLVDHPQTSWARTALGGLHRSYRGVEGRWEEFRGIMTEFAERCSDPGTRSKAEGLARVSWVLEGRYDEALRAYGQVDALAARIQMAAIYLHDLRDRGKAVKLLEEVRSQVAKESPEALAAEMLLMDAQAMPGLKPGSPEQGVQKISPLKVALSPNYPNPFNPQTVISFTLPEARHVRLVIYNVLGQRVGVLMEGMQEKGVHRVVWDGRDAQGIAVGSGLYFARLEAEGTVRSRKLLLIR